ncbi:hypothetical protein PLESTF_000409900 [Pleodorina starrii]|nr:hypothetical protein PLESTM_001451400 [Pleodorina starrii]GLC66307.1 hypothetical protein PLESTF_000409900 [Pleodorina starrii]
MAVGSCQQHLAHVAWWVLHIGGLAAVCALPSDLHLGEGMTAQRWLVAIALSLNVLTYYAVRFSDPGWADPPGPSSLPPSFPFPRTLTTPNDSTSPPLSSDCESTAAALLPTTTVAGAIPTPSPARCPHCGCLRRSPATTQHCRYCDRCVDGFDHHCMWLGVCVGGRNHHLFARYATTQTAVVLLGCHYTLTACGRRSALGYTWAYGALGLLGLLVLPLSFLTVTHVFLVLTGQTSRQVLRRFRSGSVSHRGGAGGVHCGGGGGGGGGGAGGAGSGWELLGLAQPRLSLGMVLQNGAHLVCGLRPAWLLRAGWVQRAGAVLGRVVNNRYYSCC